MDNFRDICGWVHRKIGYTGAFVTVVDQTNDREQVVRAVAEAEQRINLMYQDWLFLHAVDARSITAGTDTYAAPADLGNYDYGHWRYVVGSSEGAVSVQDGPFVGYDLNPGRPWRAVIQPDRTIRLEPPPDADATMQIQYRRNAPEMVNNADVPLIPKRFFPVIGWLAVHILGDMESDLPLSETARRHHLQWLDALIADQLPGHNELFSGSSSGNPEPVRAQ